MNNVMNKSISEYQKIIPSCKLDEKQMIIVPLERVTVPCPSTLWWGLGLNTQKNIRRKIYPKSIPYQTKPLVTTKLNYYR